MGDAEQDRSASSGVGSMHLPAEIAFDPADPKVPLTQLPRTAAVFALYGANAKDEPYIGRTPNLRARLERLLQPSARHPRRLQLAGRVRRIAWRLTGSEFESLLAQFSLLEDIYGAKALERMHLRMPAFVRFFGSNAHPRIAVTFFSISTRFPATVTSSTACVSTPFSIHSPVAPRE